MILADKIIRLRKKFRWDGSERVSEFDGALEVRYVKSQNVSKG